MIAESRTFVERLHAARQELRSVSFGLENLANAFEDTGNESVAIKLHGYAQRVEAIYASVLEAHRTKLDAEVKDVTHGIGTTLKAILDMPADHPLNRMYRGTA